MQRVKWLIRVRQAIISMFLASVAALMISTAPAYAAETTDSAATNDNPAAEATADATPMTAAGATSVTTTPADNAALANQVAEAPQASQTPAADAQAATANEADEVAPETLTVTETAAPVQADADAQAFVIDQSGEYTLQGEGTTSVVVKGDITATINMVNAVIDATGTGNSAISIIEGAQAILNIIGNCAFTGDANKAGIEVSADSGATINGDENPSTLTAIGNAGVDYDTSKASAADGDKRGAGIGGTAENPDVGAIVINGNNRNLTVSAIGGGEGASGIGSCLNGSATTITIKDAVLNHVYGGGHDAVLVGDNDAGKNIEYGKGTIIGGAAIGGGTLGTAGGDIVIDNCYGRDIVGGGKSAGIGGGCWADVTNVAIRNSDLEVEGGTTGAAIGTGRATNNTQLSVSIDGSTIVARGGVYGAGIGLGVNGSNYLLGLNGIAISNSNVIAYGGAGAAGIGAGVRGYNVNVAIDGGSTVAAYAGANYLGKYTERYNGSADTVTEDGAIGQSGAAAIGRGAWGSITTKFTDLEESLRPTISISDDSTVLAMSSGDNWAIAGFSNADDVAASVLQLRFSRNYDLAGNEFVTRAVDEGAYAESGKIVCFLDGVQQTILKIRDAETGAILYTIDTTQLDEAFANGYTGDGRVGYYSFALTVADGTYKVSTTSDVRSLDALGDALVSEGDEGYLNGATHLNADEVERQELFVVSGGMNAYDRVAFRIVADPEPVTPDPDPVDPEPNPLPPSPGGEGDDPTPEPTPEPTPAPPTPAPDPAPTPDPVPAPDPMPTPAATQPTPAPAVTPVADVATPLAGAVAPAVEIEAIADDAVPMAAAAVEAIAYDENPLAAFDGGHDEDCWVHWWILLGMIITTLYSSVVIGRRQRHSGKLNKMDKDVMDGTIGEDAPAPAPSATRGAQPAMSAAER